MRTLPQTSRAPAAPAVAAVDHAHHHDPALAAVLFDAWSGERVIHVASPPGAGKTRLITHLAHQLNTRAGLRVAVAAQTRVQAFDVVNRIAALGCSPTLLDGRQNTAPAGLHPGVRFLTTPTMLTRATITVATTARWQWTHASAGRVDILLVDEAYQCTYADLLSIGGMAEQIVLVGDPGQIEPVVTGATHRWETHPAGPHRPAPLALQQTYPDAIAEHALSHTWRCGPETTTLLQSFYPRLPFTSARPPTDLHTSDGECLPELNATLLDTRDEHDPRIAEAAAQHARDLLSTSVHTSDGTRPLNPDDLIVITPHVAQAGLIAAHLNDLPGVLIGTANAVQGAERQAAVVVHPMIGQTETTDFGTDLGRTCVALSRHRAHATVLIDSRSLDLLDQASRQPGDRAAVQAEVIRHLTP